MKKLLILLAWTLFAASIAQADELKHVGKITNRLTHDEIRTVVSKTPDHEHNVFDRHYDVYFYNSETGIEERIARDIEGIEFVGFSKDLICKEPHRRPWDCGGQTFWPLFEMGLQTENFGLFLLLTVADVAIIPGKLPVYGFQKLLTARMRKLMRATVGSSDYYYKNPKDEETKTMKLSYPRFDKLVELIKEKSKVQESTGVLQ